MLDRPTTLSQSRERALEEALVDCRLRLLDAVERLLADVDDEALRETVYAVAFDANEAVPKRADRPKVEHAYVVERLYEAHAPDGDALPTLHEFVVAVTEYYDIADDVVDGDVAPGHETEVFLVLQALLPLFVDRLGRLGPEATAFWADRAVDLVAAPFAEGAADPSVEAYLDLVDRQSALFGFVTGLAPVVAGAPDPAVERAERLGRAFYVYEQFLVDRDQWLADESDPWNLWALADEPRAERLLRERRDTLLEVLDRVPAEAADAVRPLVAQDVDAVVGAE